MVTSHKSPGFPSPEPRHCYAQSPGEEFCRVAVESYEEEKPMGFYANGTCYFGTVKDILPTKDRWSIALDNGDMFSVLL